MESKILNYRIIIIYITFFLINNYSILAEECGTAIECPGDIEYPYQVCNPDKNEKMIACIKGNPNKVDFSELGLPNARLRKAILPICQGARDIPYELFDGYGNYPTAEHRIGKYGYEGGVVVLKNSTMVDEFTEACEAWNCLCGMQGQVFDYGKCPGVINIKYTTNPKDFSTYKEGNSMSVATTLAEYKSECDPYFSFGDTTAATIVFNYTKSFIYGKEFPKKGDPVIQSFINKKYVKDVIKNSAVKNVKFFYYYSTSLHELGHALGLAHYNVVTPAGIEVRCKNGGASSGIMDAIETDDPRVSPHNDLSQTDKCAFKLLYCSDLVKLSSIYEYESNDTKVYPNPGRDAVRIDFKLENYSENVIISIIDGFGRTLLIPIENKSYESGVHSELINVDKFDNGYYYVIIKTHNKNYVNPFIVVK